MYLNLIKLYTIFGQGHPTWEKLELFPLMAKNETRELFFSLLLLNLVFEFIARAIRQVKESKGL
jgi:hypothetical protein